MRPKLLFNYKFFSEREETFLFSFNGLHYAEFSRLGNAL